MHSRVCLLSKIGINVKDQIAATDQYMNQREFVVSYSTVHTHMRYEFGVAKMHELQWNHIAQKPFINLYGDYRTDSEREEQNKARIIRARRQLFVIVSRLKSQSENFRIAHEAS